MFDFVRCYHEVGTVNCAEFQQLAEVRLKEADALLTAGLWDGAYSLAGYAVECALKACIAKLTQAEDFPPRETRDHYTRPHETDQNRSAGERLEIADRLEPDV